MGASDFNTGAKISGTKEEVFSILKVMHSYLTEKREQYREKRNCPYLSSLYIDGEDELDARRRIEQLSDEELMTFIEEKNCTIIVSASGPYGVFGLLDEVDLFHDMAEAAPNAYFEGGMGGFGTGGDQFASFELKDGHMICKYKYPNENDDWGEDEEDWDDDDYDDYDDDEDFEEPDWDYEVIYDPVKKKNVKR